VTGVSLVAFLLAIYLPSAFFRTWAERYVDLGRRKNVSQFDEIVAPIIPSLFLHFQAWLAICLGCVMHKIIAAVFRWEPWSFPGVDWRLLLTLSDASGVERLVRTLEDPYLVMWPMSYAAVLFCSHVHQCRRLRPRRTERHFRRGR